MTLAVLLLVPRTEQTVLGQAEVSKLSTVLADLAAAVATQSGSASAVQALQPVTSSTMPKSVQDAVQGRRLRMNANGDVQVYVLMTALTPENENALASAGATVEIRDPSRRRVQARVPAARLQTIAALPFVTFVRLPSYARTRVGSVTSEGDAILNADVARQQYGLDGTGVRIGVISDGIKGVFATGCTTCSGAPNGPIATGDLPASTGIRNSAGVLTSSSGGIAGQSFQSNGDLEGLPPASPACGFAGAGGEGTALLEIVHDLAPGASLSFANGDTDLAFMQAVNALAAANDIVVDDVGFFGEPYDGTSAISANTANALNNTSNPIRAYVTAVGNDADEHYFGSYVDSGIDGTTIPGVSHPGHLHLFQQTSDTTDVLGLGRKPYNVIFLPRNGEAVIFLTWDDPFGSSSNNYDLYLVQESTGRIVARSTDTQTGGQDPVEFIDFVNPGAQDYFHIVVQNVNNTAQSRHLNLFSFQPECATDGPRVLAPPRHDRHNYNTLTRSVSAEGDAGGSPASVISVAAICSGSSTAASLFSSTLPDESCNDRNHATAEFFSSRGPTLDGRTKPDIAAIDGVSVTGAGRFGTPFFGTSAAAPHVAAIAGLLLQSAPCLLSTGGIDASTARVRLRNVLIGGAQPMASPVPDNTFGAGRADALGSIQKTLPVLSGARVTVSGNTPTGASLSASQLGFSDPDQCSLTTMNWTGGCGTSPGSNLNCPFGTTNVSVRASNNGTTFSPASDLQITVTNFSMTATPGTTAVASGQSATFSATVSAQGGAFTAPVALACTNLPAGTNCTFNPPSVTPGAGSSSSRLTITTTGRTSVSGTSGGNASGIWALLVAAMLTLIITERAERADPAKSSWRLAAASAVTVAACVAVQSGCGGGTASSSTSTSSNSPATRSIAVTPSTLSFSAQTVQTTSAPQTVNVTNSGTTAVAISGISTSGDFAQTNTCPGSLTTGESCSIALTFTPTAAGVRPGVLTIADNAAGGPHTVTLAGTAQVANAGAPGVTQAGTYVIGITGQAGSLAQSTSVTLVVQ
ncbi:MAG TPA: choice-of-anchor D domain-containing protein [Vicinamibacterales bacterium]|nr:choice-of-anchor D domain-containing protein [Vicinamibacterales bacterium]